MEPKRPRIWHTRPLGITLVWLKQFLLAGLIYAMGGFQAQAQLAITEAMSQASSNCTCCVSRPGYNADFWELTNFGTNIIDLSGYLFSDANGLFPDAAWRLPEGIGIRPNESIIFLRDWLDTPDAGAFRLWWGTEKLPTNLQIFIYPGHGFDHTGDAVRLWDNHSNLLDQIYFGETRGSFTFTYDTECGGFVQSEIGSCGAFQAATCTDVGSPGWAPCGPVQLRITQQPTSQTVDAGNDVTLGVRACGLPRPRYQWYFNGVPLLTSTATNFSVPRLAGFADCGPAWIESPAAPDLTISDAQPLHAGEYFVEVFNGLERLTSAVVRLTVNTIPSPVRLECPPSSTCVSAGGKLSPPGLTVAPGQTAVFTVMARGYPPPAFQWSRNVDGTGFVELPSETNRTLAILSAQLNDAGVYRVRVNNSVSATNGFATLIVKPKPQLKITEAMSDGCLPANNDWWELTNFGDEPVNLCGYRWDDTPGNIGGGPTVTNEVIIQPFESVIFLEGTTREFFIDWWGATNLPSDLQVIGYTASGLDFLGDEINLWNPTATNDHDYIDSVDFSTATPHASFWFDTFVCVDPDFVRVDTPSIEGKCGAFRSAEGCDVGSPGWTRLTPPRLTWIRRNGSAVTLEWKAQPGSTNLLQYTTSLAAPAGATRWNDLGAFSSPSAIGTTKDCAVGTQRFYRVKRIGSANCPCPPDTIIQAKL